MAEELFDVYLTGGVSAGLDPHEVAARLASLMRVSQQRAVTLLSAPVCVKRGVDMATARRYQAALAATGANARMQAQTAAGSRPSSSAVPLSQPDLTEPFSEVSTPHPGHRRRVPLWPVVAILLVMMLTLLAAGYRWLLPQPVPPGQALRQVGEALNQVQPYQEKVEAFWREHDAAPSTAAQLGLKQPVNLGGLAQLNVLAAGRLQLTFMVPAIRHQTLVLSPHKGDQGVEWDCREGTLVQTERPRGCRRDSLPN